MVESFHHPLEIEDECRMLNCANCDSCLEWHQYCGAECCCFLMVLNGKFDLSGKFLVVDGVMSKDLRWYYELHGMRFVDNVMLIPTELCVRDGNNIVVNARCSLLNDDLKCSGHYYNKPLFCRRFTEYSVVSGRNKGSIVTPNCLFKYKKMLKEGKH